MIKNMLSLFKGFVRCKGKKPIQSMSDDDLLTYDEVKDFDSFSGVLKDGIIDISFDTDELSQIFWEMAESNDWNCFIQENPENGHIHSFWKVPKGWDFKDGKDKKSTAGFTEDIHHNGTCIPIKVDGVMREFIFVPDIIDYVPEELYPIKTDVNLIDLGDGDGRNDELFRYILVLKSKLGFDNDVIKRIIQNINKYILKEPLPDSEIETITRDEAFPEEVFYDGKKFLHNQFATFIKNQCHVIRINGQLHCYKDGVYVPGKREIEAMMVKYIPTLRDAQRSEVLKYLEIMSPNDSEAADAHLIAFSNGIYDMSNKTLSDFNPDVVITNKIPWDYNPAAYSQDLDDTLNRLACDDAEVRHLLEECVGYCFFRRNELSKAFILTGEGANGKSTFLDVVKAVLGQRNYSALDLDELDERFSVAALSGMLANIGDDISDGFLQGKSVANFKKIVSGNQVKAEIKNDPNIFWVKPQCKLLMSANNLPRIRSGGSMAIMRRLVIIPFNARFVKGGEGYDPYIISRLKTQESMEYMIQLGLQGLDRVITNSGFTESDRVKAEVSDYEISNNPIMLFLEEHEISEFENNETKVVHREYKQFCYDNGFGEMTLQNFSKELRKRCGLEVKRVRIKGKLTGIYVRGER